MTLSEKALASAQQNLDALGRSLGGKVKVDFVNDSVRTMLRTHDLSSRWFSRDIDDSGSAATPSETQAPLVRPGPMSSATACLPLSPANTPSTSARRRSRSSAGMPYTTASPSTNSAVVSRKATVSAAAADSALNVPMPGMVTTWTCGEAGSPAKASLSNWRIFASACCDWRAS